MGSAASRRASLGPRKWKVSGSATRSAPAAAAPATSSSARETLASLSGPGSVWTSATVSFFMRRLPPWRAALVRLPGRGRRSVQDGGQGRRSDGTWWMLGSGPATVKARGSDMRQGSVDDRNADSWLRPYLGLSSGTLGHLSSDGFLDWEIQPLFRPVRMVGPALTVACQPTDNAPLAE